MRSLRIASLVLSMLIVACAVTAQTAAPAPAAATPIQNLYAAGVSYNVGASPAVAGTGLYAHLVASPGTYAFTAVDVLPASTKPFTVNTNFGVGIAQQIATIGKIPIFVPTSAGVSFNGVNTGWQWNAGALAVIKLKGNYSLLPTVRLVKSSVGGSGYQPIVGLLFGWGQ